MPAYNAAGTLIRTLKDVPRDLVDDIILVDDASWDDTVELARLLGLRVLRHQQNLGYGGNQKTCYGEALAAGADIVVMVHPDYQYDPTRIPDLVAPIVQGDADMVLGSRFLGEPLDGGMPKWRYLLNRGLTRIQNRIYKRDLAEYHTGFRAYSRTLLEQIDFRSNSDNFVFDQQLISQAVAKGFVIGEVPVPTRYFPGASSVGFGQSLIYVLQTLWTLYRHLMAERRPGPKAARKEGSFTVDRQRRWRPGQDQLAWWPRRRRSRPR